MLDLNRLSKSILKSIGNLGTKSAFSVHVQNPHQDFHEFLRVEGEGRGGKLQSRIASASGIFLLCAVSLLHHIKPSCEIQPFCMCAYKILAKHAEGRIYSGRRRMSEER